MSDSARPSAGPEARAALPWLRNAWLLAAALALGAPLVSLGLERFVELVRLVYTTQLAQFAPEFRVRLAREIQALYWILLAAAGLLATAWAGFSLSRRSALGWLLGANAGDWRGRALVLVIASSSLLLAVRAVRDVVRFQFLRGLSFEEQRERLGAESPIEPSYAQAREFLARHGPRPGNVFIVRAPGTLQAHSIFLAAYLFPVRVYVGSEDELTPALIAKRDIRWVQREAAQTAFAPEPLEHGVR